MQEQLDRMEKKLDVLVNGLTGKQSPFSRDDDAPPQQRDPVEGFERVFGPKPKIGTAEYALWRLQILKTNKVYASVPDEFEAGAMDLAAETGVKAVFLEYEGELKAALTVEPSPWFTDPTNFIGSNVEGLKRAVKDDRRFK